MHRALYNRAACKMRIRSLPRACWAIMAFCLLLQFGSGPSHAVPADVNPADALPSPAELKHFSDFQFEHSVTADRVFQEAELRAERDDDGLRLRIQVILVRNDALAAELIHRETNTPGGPLPPCSHTGRRFGDEIFHTFEYDGGPDRLGFSLCTRMGRAFVRVDLTEKLRRGGRRDEAPLVDEADMRLAEDLTIGCLQRLARMGIGTMARATALDAPPVADTLREVIAPIVQMPGYKAAHFTKGPHGHDEIEITRKTDGLKIKVHLSISPTVQEAMSLAQTEATKGSMEKGSFTMCQFGHQVWHRTGSGEKQDSRFALLTRMGSAVIRIEASGGSAAARSLNPADCQTAEEITVGCLQRLVPKGIGTKMVAWRRPAAPKPWPGDEDPDGK
jgi:hypothetical protein